MVVVRSKYIAGRGSRGKGVGKALAHLKYIQHRPGPDREQGGRELFGDLEDRVDATEVRKEIRQIGNQKVVVHKMTLAPEINPADKKAFTSEVLGELGRAKGLDLKWYGVEHNNTEHHHIHVVIFGKDRHGTDVKIDKKDLDKVRELGDRYLEREHPRELEQAREERQRRQKEKQLEWERQRQERVKEGLELPWMHKKIIREQLEPYEEWRKKQDLKEQEREQAQDQKVEEPAKEKIRAAGQEWTKDNSLKELRDLNQNLWDNFEKRIPKDEYKKLAGWIKEKEHEQREERDQPEPKKDDAERKKQMEEWAASRNKAIVDKLATELSLTEVQKVNIETVLTNMNTKRGEVMERGRAARDAGEDFDWQAEMKAVSDASLEEVKAELSSAQVSTLNTLLGDNGSLDSLGGRGGFGGGRGPGGGGRRGGNGG